MNKNLLIFCAGLTLLTGSAQAQWNNWGAMPGGSSITNPNMMPWGGQGYSRPQYTPQPYGSNFMPWGGQQAPAYQTPQQPFASNMMPWGGYRTPPPPPRQQPFGGGMMPWGMNNSAPVYSQPAAQPFGGGMMPWNGMSQPQARPQPQSQGYMMPGMDQGIRSMMQPGKIMAEEATPGMYMKPTWR